MDMNKPMVSVMVITYNHAKFIRQTIESVIRQKTDFPFIIHVIEDCSTDGTQAILHELQREHPDKIKLFLNEKNIGSKVTQKNMIRGFKTLRGKYVSILEGDDYWGNTRKLQTQVNFLEANPDFAAYGHDTIKFINDESFPSSVFLETSPKDVHTVQDLIRITSFFHTSTLIYRNVLKDRVPKNFISPWSCDIFNAIAHADHGKFYYEKKGWSFYRSHPGGMFSNMPVVKGWFFNIGGLRRYNQWLGYRYLRDFSASISKYCKHVLGAQAKGEVRLTFYQHLKIGVLYYLYRGLFIFCTLFVLPGRTLRKAMGMRPRLDLSTVSLAGFDTSVSWLDRKIGTRAKEHSERVER